MSQRNNETGNSNNKCDNKMTMNLSIFGGAARPTFLKKTSNERVFFIACYTEQKIGFHGANELPKYCRYIETDKVLQFPI